MGITNEKRHIEIFCCYAHQDQSLLIGLKKHFKLWERQGLITLWTDTNITPGTNWQKEIEQHLQAAHIILFLVSPDFLASDYCYSTEMIHAMERYERGEVYIIPIILRSCAWEEAPFSQIQALPTDAKPVVGSGWHNEDEAFLDIVEGIRATIEHSVKASQPHSAGMATDRVKPRPVRSTMKVPKQEAVVPDLTIKRKKIARASSSQAALLYIYQGHKYGAYGLAWSPDGTRLASAGGDGTVQVWRGTDGNHLLTYHEHTAEFVNTVAWSPDGTRLASGADDKTVQVWDATTGDHIYTYRGHHSGVKSVAWSPDGTCIASGGPDGTVQIWSAADGSHLFTYHKHDGRVSMVTWAPHNKWIASVSGIVVHIWDATNGECVCQYRGHTPKYRRRGGVTAIAWSPNGKHIASASRDGLWEGSVQIWNAASGNRIYKYDNEGSNFVVWSPNSTIVASADDNGTIRLWDAMDGEHVFAYHGHFTQEVSSRQWVRSVAWSPDGKCLASAATEWLSTHRRADDHWVQVWNPDLLYEGE